MDGAEVLVGVAARLYRGDGGGVGREVVVLERDGHRLTGEAVVPAVVLEGSVQEALAVGGVGAPRVRQVFVADRVASGGLRKSGIIDCCYRFEVNELW